MGANIERYMALDGCECSAIVAGMQTMCSSEHRQLAACVYAAGGGAATCHHASRVKRYGMAC